MTDVKVWSQYIASLGDPLTSQLPMPPANPTPSTFHSIVDRVATAATRAGHPASLLAVSKGKPSQAIRALTETVRREVKRLRKEGLWEPPRPA